MMNKEVNTTKAKWFSTEFLQSTPDGVVDMEKGVIEGVSVCTVGEAKGHCVNLDQEFIETVTKFGSEKKQGLKARFGHPNMCSTALGTFIGRFKNFRVIGNRAKADLFLSPEAKETPHGNLYDYVLGMAKNEPDMFGTSIVFSPGRNYKRKGTQKIFAPGESVDVGERGADYDEWRELKGPVFIECAKLHACDAVDQPAANDGLFSQFSQETVAGQITEFLDLNPDVWMAVESNPSIVEALARHADKMDGFMERYRDYREHSKENNMFKSTEDSFEEKLNEAHAELEKVKNETEASVKESFEAGVEQGQDQALGKIKGRMDKYNDAEFVMSTIDLDDSEVKDKYIEKLEAANEAKDEALEALGKDEGEEAVPSKTAGNEPEKAGKLSVAEAREARVAELKAEGKSAEEAYRTAYSEIEDKEGE